MDPQQFKEFVIKTAKKYIFEDAQIDEEKKILQQPKPPKLSKPTFTKRGVNEVPKVTKVPKEPKIPQSVSIANPPVESKSAKTESINESFSPDKIKTLVEEMKKINKKIDLRNPLISPEFFGIISEEKTVIKEEKSERWKNLYNYEIPKDELR